MAKVNGNYEVTMVFSLKNGEESATALMEKFKTMISENATITAEDVWGKRRLAYTVDHQDEGFYYLVRFSSKPDFPSELERVFNITDGILRTLVVSEDEK